MSNYFISGSTINIGKEADLQLASSLPVASYTVTPTRSGFELTQVDDFVLPEKIYGNVDTNCERILSTFADRPNTTGVHLSGVKGSGKTLLVKQLSKIGAERGYPTLVINQALCGEAFNDFMQSIDTPCIVIFDEFEKTYGHEDQERILTLFDGVYPSKKLFVLTTNDRTRVSNYLSNRPGRMFYRFDYETLPTETVIAVLEDRLNDKSQIPAIVRYTKIFTFINFDMLVAITEEMNRYNETLSEVLKVLNIRGELSTFDRYDILANVGGVEIPVVEKMQLGQINNFQYSVSNEHLYDSWIKSQPTALPAFDDDGCPDTHMIGTFNMGLASYAHVEIEADDLASFDEATDTFVFTTKFQDQDISLLIRKRKWSTTTDSGASKVLAY